MKSTKNLVSIIALIFALFTLSFASVYTVAQAQNRSSQLRLAKPFICASQQRRPSEVQMTDRSTASQLRSWRAKDGT